MLRPGQFSLGYLFLETLWVALAVYFFRLLFLVATNVRSPVAPFTNILVLTAALFFLSIAVGGLFNFRGMQLGAVVGAMLVVLLYLLLLAVMLTD
ncbi:MAG: hypothetical protein MUF06_17895 [Pirellulaceae bacterium]|jgi:hypothetical protein|nr:hypothetical protein [Pirellulaceae bacterium]